MDFSTFIISLIQGILEWFPVSSSGHISLIEIMLGIQSGIDLEVALHFGTLMAVFVYFRKDIVNILRDLLHSKWNTSNAKIGILVFIGSIPAAFFGFFLRNYFQMFSILPILGLGWIVTSISLFIGSFSITNLNSSSKLSYSKALIIGFVQVLALIPGVSRSGMTLSSGLFFGLNEKEALKFSYLLSIPAIIGANIVTFGNRTIPFDLLLPTVLCFFVGIIFINFSFNYVLNKKKNLKWFGIYTLILGLTCLYYSFF